MFIRQIKKRMFETLYRARGHIYYNRPMLNFIYKTSSRMLKLETACESQQSNFQELNYRHRKLETDQIYIM